MRALDVATKFKIWKFANETMAGVLSRLSFATAAEKQLKQQKHWTIPWTFLHLKDVIQRPQIALALRTRAILLVFKKIYSCLFIPNCTRNHVITYTNVISMRSKGRAVQYWRITS